MSFNGRKIQIILDRLQILFLILFLLISTPGIIFAQTVQLAEPSESASLAKTYPITNQNLSQETYGPVRSNEGLWEIADSLRANIFIITYDITIPQMAVALFEKNPEAFKQQNINGLLVGSFLKIPDIKEIQKLKKAEAFTLFLQHWEIWKEIKSEKTDSNDLLIQDDIIQTPETKEKLQFIETKNTTTLEKQELTEKITHELKTATVKKNQSEQKITNNSIDYLTQPPFKLSSFISNMSQQFTHSPITVILSGLLLLFIFLVWLTRREDTDFVEMTSSKSTTEHTAYIDDKHTRVTDKILTNPNYVDIDNTFLDKDLLPLLKDSLLLAEGSINTRHNSNITPANTNKPINSDYKKTKRKGKNLLESAFEEKFLSNSIGFIHEKKPLTETDHSKVNPLLNSINEIRFVNEETRNSKAETFFNETLTEKLTDKMFSHDFDTLKNANKVDIFIQEFEDIMVNMETYTPEINSTPDNLENLLQFKSSIHFIKVLSNMMQATQLKQLSTTIIEFLENILDKNTTMTKEVTKRLLIVVNFYNRYIYLVKENYKHTLEV